MTSFPKLALIAIISKVYNLKSVDGFTTSSRDPAIHLLNSHVKKHLIHSSSSSTLMAEKRPGNPFQSFLGDVASSVVSNISGGGSGSDGVVNEALDQKLNLIESLSNWDEIKDELKSKQTDEEKAFRSTVEKGIGRASPLNKIRLFDDSNKEEDVRVVLYRDSASWCPCKLS